jgi:hypothetical protein
MQNLISNEYFYNLCQNDCINHQNVKCLYKTTIITINQVEIDRDRAFLSFRKMISIPINCIDKEYNHILYNSSTQGRS